MEERLLPIGIQDFEKLRKGNYIYVDKTALIYELVQTSTPYFLSRPRRFGKSLLLSTMECYFLGKKELFKGLAIEKLEKEWIEYPVIKISFGRGTCETKERLISLIDTILSEYENKYVLDCTSRLNLHLFALKACHMCRMFLNKRRTRPGMTSTFLNDCVLNCFGIAMNSAIANNPKRIHHFSHHSGIVSVTKIEIPVNRTIRIERGINACWIVLSTKFILP